MEKNKSKKIAEKKEGKKITIQKLAQMMVDGFTQIRKESADGFKQVRKEMTDGFAQSKKDNEDLAIMVQQGFEEAKIENDLRFTKLENKVDRLEQSQEQMTLRQDNVAYRFELVEVQQRIQRVEDIVLVRRQTGSKK